jgi:hypothetical protein
MVTVTKTETKAKPGRDCYKGIVRDARKLGVSRQHLFYVLEGLRESPRLLRRYNKLKGAAQ